MRLYLLQLALTGDQDQPVPGYLIQTDDGINVVIDTGYSPEFVAMARQPDFAGMAIHDVVPITDHLAALGVAPEDVQYLIATHLDPDHAGEHDAFPNAEIVIQRAHYHAAMEATDRRYTMTKTALGCPRPALPAHRRRYRNSCPASN